MRKLIEHKYCDVCGTEISSLEQVYAVKLKVFDSRRQDTPLLYNISKDDICSDCMHDLVDRLDKEARKPF